MSTQQETQSNYQTLLPRFIQEALIFAVGTGVGLLLMYLAQLWYSA